MPNTINQTKNSAGNSQLQNAEKIAVFLSFGGTITGYVLQKYFIAFAPICCALGLNLVNRQKMLATLQQQHQSEFTELNSDYEAQATRIKKLEGKQTKDLLQTQTLQTDLRKQIISAENKIKQLELSLIEVNEVSRNLDNSILELNRQQNDIDSVVKELRVLGNSDEKDSNDESPANFYCKRGLIYHERQKYKQALKDFNQALQLDDQFAPAYHHSGLTYLNLGNKHKAFENLRKASQLYFASNDLDKYHQVRKLSQKLYHAEENKAESADQKPIINKSQESTIAVDDLFA